MVSRFLIAVPFLVLAACAPRRTQETPSPSRNLITAEEIQAIAATTANDIIHQLRPNWLRGRGPVSMSRGGSDLPVVYVDDVRSSDPNVLDHMSAQIVREIRFVPARDASTLYGLDHSGGAILITTGR